MAKVVKGKRKSKIVENKRKIKYLILGAGRMAKGILYYLSLNDPEGCFHIVDRQQMAIDDMLKFAGQNIRKKLNLKCSCDDIRKISRIKSLMCDSVVAISCAHYELNTALTETAISCGCNLVDLGGNPQVVHKQFKFDFKARKSAVTVIPDTGLAPGMTNILTFRAIEGFTKLDSVKIRVGGVPVNPIPPLNYMLVFSPEGLINEYVEDALVIRDGKICRVESLSDVESIFIKGFGKMEAFNTSGGSSTLVETLKGKVKNLDYKTIRYPGHSFIMNGIKQIGLMNSEFITGEDGEKINPRKVLGLLLEKYLPFKDEDAVILKITVEGEIEGKRRKRIVTLIDRFDRDSKLSAMTRCTSFPSACIAMMIANGKISKRGVQKQELVVPSRDFVKMMRKAGLSINLRTVSV